MLHVGFTLGIGIEAKKTGTLKKENAKLQMKGGGTREASSILFLPGSYQEQVDRVWGCC